MSYFFDDIIKIEDFNLNNISIDEKLYENILVYNISYKKSWLLLNFCVLDSIKYMNGVFGGTSYLLLFGSENYDFIYNKIRYLVGVKRSITYVISHNYAKIKVDSYDSLPLEKTMTFHNVIILVKSLLLQKYILRKNFVWIT